MNGKLKEGERKWRFPDRGEILRQLRKDPNVFAPNENYWCGTYASQQYSEVAFSVHTTAMSEGYSGKNKEGFFRPVKALYDDEVWSL